MMMEGGIRMPSVAPEAITAVEVASSYLALRISGMATRVMVAQVAIELPQMAAKPAQAAMAERASPPRKRPSQALEARNSSRDMPELVASTPIRMKNGTRVRLKSVMTRIGEVVSRLSAGPGPRM